MRWIDVLGITALLIDACVGPPEPLFPPIEVRAEVQQDGAQWFLVVRASRFTDLSGEDIYGSVWGTAEVLLPDGAPVEMAAGDWPWGWGPTCVESELGPIHEGVTSVELRGAWTSRLSEDLVVDVVPLPEEAPVWRDGTVGGEGRCRGPTRPPPRPECLRLATE